MLLSIRFAFYSKHLPLLDFLLFVDETSRLLSKL
uniref:Uncharacterized protein n=1 Tax=Utricularia reniformis TaxID=192314 RepID=A0A1Y0B492_9LAMI|nr:hypothetical protein AEK19_MT2077 [Utricularia reniformis]ART32232.1 hypothetical protein AEK19_MT2077 [Utricularia reniformis]